MWVLFWVLVILIGVPVTLALVPVRYRVAARVGTDATVRVTVSYLLHLFHMTFVYAGKKTELKILLAGFNVTGKRNAETAAPRKPKKEKKVKPKKTKPEKPKADKEPVTPREVLRLLTHLDLKTIIGVGFKFLSKMVKYLLPRRFNVTGTVGLGDPCNTGLLFAALSGVLHSLNKNRHIMINGDFNNSVVELDITANGRVSAAGMLAPVIWLLTQKPIYKLIIEYIKRNRYTASRHKQPTI